MLESLAALVLNNYLGQYLESVNTEQLSVALLKGAVELENIPLRHDALVGFDVPFCIKTGFVGKIRLSIPVRRMASESWSISIQQLYVVLGPIDVSNVDADVEREASNFRKLQTLDAEEAAWRSEVESNKQSSYYTYTYSSWMRYGNSMLSSIVSNLQLSIREVHIRFEDSQTLPERCIAVGLTLSSLTAQSCDSCWVPGYVADADGRMRFKLVEMKRMDVYWDTDAEPYAGLPLGILAEKMMVSLQHEFILSPVSFEARWKRDCTESPLRSCDRPRHTLQVRCNKLSLSLSSDQFSQCVLLTRSMEMLNRRRRHMHHRPGLEVSDAPTQWWRFAFRCCLEQVRARRSHWNRSVFSQRCRELVEYARIYKDHLRCPALLSGTDLAAKDRIECEWSEKHLRAVRVWCMRCVIEESHASFEGTGQVGVLNWWMGFWYEPECKTRLKTGVDLDSAIASSVENRSVFCRDAVFCSLSFSLLEMSIHLLTSINMPCDVLNVSLQQADVQFDWRPRTNSYALNFSLGSLVVRDYVTANSIFPSLIAPLCRDQCSNSDQTVHTTPNVSAWTTSALKHSPLLNVCFERNPLHSKTDYRVLVDSQSLEIVYNLSAIEAIKRFFTVHEKYPDSLVEWGNAARSRFERTREDILNSWEHILEYDNLSREVWDIRLNMAAPNIIFPENLSGESELLLVVDLGFLKLSTAFSEEVKHSGFEPSEPQNDEEFDDEDMFCTPCSSPMNEPATRSFSQTQQITAASVRRQMYDRVSVELGSIQVLVGRSSDSWRAALTTGVSHLHLLDKFYVCVQLERCRFPAVSVGSHWPMFVVSGQLNQLMVHVSEFKVKALFVLLTTLPFEQLEQPGADDVFDRKTRASRNIEDSLSAADNLTDVDSSNIPAILQCNFGIGQAAVSVESRGNAIGEIQVSDACLSFVKHERRVCVELSILNILVVDAVQCYGADYDILMASHTDARTSNISGTLDSVCGADSQCRERLSDVFSSRTHKCQSSGMLHCQKSHRAVKTEADNVGSSSDELIKLVFIVQFPDTCDGCVHQRIAVKFNALDVIVNQQTFVEFIDFIGRVSSVVSRQVTLPLHLIGDVDEFCKGDQWFMESPIKMHSQIPLMGTSVNKDVSSNSEECSKTHIDSELPIPKVVMFPSEKSDNCVSLESQTEETAHTAVSVLTKTSLEVDFYELHVLLLRRVDTQTNPVAYKVATMTLSDAHMEMNQRNDEYTITGSLGGLQMRSLCGSSSGVVFSVGRDPAIKRHCHSSEFYDDQSQSALNVTFVTEDSHSLRLHVASVCYVHSTRFVEELTLCVSEFTRYFNLLVGAAADVAIQQKDIIIACVVESPVLVLPECERSLQALVTHLGRIQVENYSCNRYRIEVCDMNIYSVDLSGSFESGDPTLSNLSLFVHAELYDVRSCGDPIMYNTGVEICIELSDQVHIEHKFSTALRLSVLKSQYEQILRTINYMSSADSAYEPSHSGPTFVNSPSQSPIDFSCKTFDPDAKVMHGNFNLAQFEIELRSDTCDDKPAYGLVLLSLHDLKVTYQRSSDYSKHLEMYLREVTMEDLLMDPHTSFRFMLSSLVVDEGSSIRRTSCLSQSCPCLLSGNVERTIPDIKYGSLPSRLSQHIGANMRSAVPENLPKCRASITSTATRTKVNRSSSDAASSVLQFVPIQCLFDTVKNGSGTERQSLVVIFNGLNVILTPQSWVMVLDFFFNKSQCSSHGDAPSVPCETASSGQGTLSQPPADEAITFTVDVCVRNLSLLVNHLSIGSVARVDISDLECCCSMVASCISRISGRLRSMKVDDLNNCSGHLYRERLITTSQEAVQFEMLYNNVDFQALHEYSGRLKIRLSPVLYVHTQRFTTELSIWLAEFTELQQLLSGLQNASHEAVQSPTADVRGSLLHLDLQAGAPVLIVPVDAKSDRLLVVDLGRLQMTNEIVFSQRPPEDIECGMKCRRYLTLFRQASAPSETPTGVFDVIKVVLSDVHVYSALRISYDCEDIRHMSGSSRMGNAPTRDILMGSFFVRAEPAECDIVRDTFCLQVKIARSLQLSHAFPHVSISGQVSTLSCSISLLQYCLICEIIRCNICEKVDLPSSSLFNAVSHSSPCTGSTEHNRSLSFRASFLLQNVSLELSMTTDNGRESIARIDFVHSQVIYGSDSVGRYEVVLLSRHIQLSDTRYLHLGADSRPNVFSTILQPLSGDTNGHVCVELSYRFSSEGTDVACVLTNMRLIGLPDWWMCVVRFFTDKELFNDDLADPKKDEPSKSIPGVVREVLVVTNVAPAPVGVGVGVVTRRTAAVANASKALTNSSLKLDNCELVLLEDASLPDTMAVILKATSVNLLHRPSACENPFNCEIKDCEVFSCVMGQFEQTTSLSIVDPFTMNAKIVSHLSNTSPSGISEVHETPSVYYLIVQLQQICLRLSYHDGLLFVSLLQRFPKQVGIFSSGGDKAYDNRSHFGGHPVCNQVNTRAGNAPSCFSNIGYYELDLKSFSLFIIDDYGDADVPLLDLAIGYVVFQLGGDGSWSFQCQLSIDYYNRLMSGWEPLVEPVRCKMSHKLVSADRRYHEIFELAADSVVNVNMTSAALQLAYSVSASWIHGGGARRRAQFVPFSLLNKTGCTVYMRVESTDDWKQVDVGQSVPFLFGEKKSKKRHDDSHSVQRRRISLRLDGWKSCSLVSVEKVGVYFRDILDEKGIRMFRLVLAVEMDGPARKLITVRSSLQVHNRLHLPLCILAKEIGSSSLQLLPGQREPLPMRWIYSGLSFKLLCEGDYWTENSETWCWWKSMKSVVCNYSNYSLRFHIDLESDGFPKSDDIDCNMPGHTAVVLAPFYVTNLLPCLLRFSVGHSSDPVAEYYRVTAGGHLSLTHIDVSKRVYITMCIDGFVAERCFELGSVRAFNPDPMLFSLLDDRKRRLVLHMRFECCLDAWYKLSVSAPYWVVNHFGLPLIVGQEGGDPVEAAGQDDSHEQARSLAPLLFSLSDSDAPEMMVLRLGRGHHSGASVDFCARFPLQPGCYQRKLHVTCTYPSQAHAYEVGIVIRRGQGRYADTIVITVTPRYQLDNKTDLKLLLSEVPNTPIDRLSDDSFISFMPRSQMAFHWTFYSSCQLLRVKIKGVVGSQWCGPFRINRVDSFYVNIRDVNGSCQLIRVEIVPQGASLNVIFFEAIGLPPPIMLINSSEVNVTFYQNVEDDFGVIRGVMRPGTSTPYTWDRSLEPIRHLSLIAPCGSSYDYDIEQPGSKESLRYDIVVFLSVTANTCATAMLSSYCAVDNDQLVFDVENDAVVLRRKRLGERSQLWRHLVSGHLVHEGSIPPGQAITENDQNLKVLDIAAVAVQPNIKSKLCVRLRHDRRSITQKWFFNGVGQLRCNVPNVCAQVESFLEHNPVVLGLVDANAHSYIEPQQQWPGSGELAVRVYIDGPTKVLHVSDASSRAPPPVESVVTDDNSSMVSLNIDLPEGVAISLIANSGPAELLCILFSGLTAKLCVDSARLMFDLWIRNIQCDCHLPYTPTPVVLFSRSARVTADPLAFEVDIKWHFSKDPNIYVFKRIVVKFDEMVVKLEETLLYELLLFFSEIQGQKDYNEQSTFDRIGFLGSVHCSHNASLDRQRYSIAYLEVSLGRINLSVLTRPRLEPRLSEFRRNFGLRLVQFENAQIELDKFVRKHIFESFSKLVNLMSEHYVEELKSQSAVLLVSTDFLGNPLGFFNDLSEGVTVLMTQGDLGGLIKNVTHGMANSAAKVTGSLSDVVGWATMDEKHDDRRRRIRQVHSATEDHLMGGVRGLGLGLWGGASSLVVQPIQGAVNQGLWGFISGIGKGLVGTVAKPAVGVLDLAASTANAVKDTSSRREHQSPSQQRLGRVVQGPDGLVPIYSSFDAKAQHLLYSSPKFRRGERFVSCCWFCKSIIHSMSRRNLRADARPALAIAGVAPQLSGVERGEVLIISTHMIRVVSKRYGSWNDEVMSLDQLNWRYVFDLSKVRACRKLSTFITASGCCTVLLEVADEGGDIKLACDSEDVADQVVELVNFARAYREEMHQTIVNH